MANRSWRQQQAACPYYHTSHDQAITCSCGVGGIKGLKQIFDSGLPCSEWFRRFCATNYRGCKNYQRISDEIEKEGRP